MQEKTTNTFIIQHIDSLLLGSAGFWVLVTEWSFQAAVCGQFMTTFHMFIDNIEIRITGSTLGVQCLRSLSKTSDNIIIIIIISL